MGGCVGTSRDGAMHSGESSDISGTCKHGPFSCFFVRLGLVWTAGRIARYEDQWLLPGWT